MTPPTARPIRIALVDDYDVVLKGLASMLRPYRDRVEVAELDLNRPVSETVDIALFDSFAQTEPDHGGIEVLVDSPRTHRVVVYTWNFHPQLVTAAKEKGADGYLSKTLSAGELVSALEAVHAGRRVISDPPPRARPATDLDWPGRQEGLTDRESEILALITQGRSNADIAELTYLSPNTIKTHIRSLYRKIDAESRTQAVLWGLSHGFAPDHRRLKEWSTSSS